MNFTIEESDEETFEEKKLKEQQKKCPVCGNFFVRKWGFQVYCSNDCRIHAKSVQIKEYMRRRRLKNIGKNAFSILEDLAKRQQFVDDKNIIQKGNCFACGSTENLVEHHIKYIPEEKVILCKRCHSFLHNNLLNKRHCKPRTV